MPNIPPRRPEFGPNRDFGPRRDFGPNRRGPNDRPDDRGGRPGPRQQGRPAPARRPRNPGPSTVPPFEPKSGKQRRRMLKSAVWRLAKLAHVAPAALLKTEDLQSIIEKVDANSDSTSEVGDAARLVAKIERLRGIEDGNRR